MTGTVRRILSACFVLSVGLAGLAIPASAQAQYGHQRVAEGSHVWGDDGWCYVMQRGRLLRTAYFRVFPDPRNRAVFNLYENGRFVRQVVASPQPAAGNRQPGSAEVGLQRLINQLNQLTAAAPRPGGRAATPRGNATPFGCETVPMYGPLTPEQKRCKDAMIQRQVTAGQLGQFEALCEQRRAAGPYAGITRQQQEDARRRGQLAEGWYDTPTGPRLKGC